MKIWKVEWNDGGESSGEFFTDYNPLLCKDHGFQETVVAYYVSPKIAKFLQKTGLFVKRSNYEDKDFLDVPPIDLATMMPHKDYYFSVKLNEAYTAKYGIMKYREGYNIWRKYE